jgi:hypothetical protein
MNDCDPVVDYSIAIGLGAVGARVGYGVGGSAMAEGLGQQVGMTSASNLGQYSCWSCEFFPWVLAGANYEGC